MHPSNTSRDPLCMATISFSLAPVAKVRHFYRLLLNHTEKQIVALAFLCFFSLTHPCQRQDGYVADDIFNYIFFKENINIFIQIILRKFVSNGIIGYALYQVPVSTLANHHDSTWRLGSNHQSTIKFDLRSKWNGRRQFSFENRWTSL